MQAATGQLTLARDLFLSRSAASAMRVEKRH